jgi:pimeloyl-ACP methyl ester carboxylesterase
LHDKKHMTPRIASAIGGAIVLGKLGLHRLGATRFYRFALSRTDGSTAFDDLEQEARDSMVANSRSTVAELEAGTGEELTDTSISAIACPTAVIVGGRTARFLVEAADRVSRLLPSGRVVGVPEGDHVMNIRQPGLLANAIGDCIEGWTRS